MGVIKLEGCFSQFDTDETKLLRKNLVDYLYSVYAPRELKNQEVRRALLEVPRHVFIPWHDSKRAYMNTALPSVDGQTISQPYIVALMTELIMPLDGKKVLEIGTGTGYQTALIAHLGAEVYSIEINEKLHRHAARILEELCSSFSWKHCPKLYLGDGSAGLPEEAPFDRIIVTAAAPEFPETLYRQLKKGGIMVVPVGSRDHQNLYRIFKAGKPEIESHGGVIFVPLKGEKGF